ncbi:MAG: hypothetical protein PHR35_15400 [Kiritimatiellae bacterium]|nr:hypothetical protein [Kiritimatiellia bacterium]
MDGRTRLASSPASLPTYACKPDWSHAQARWDAFWDMQPTDRPCLNISVPRTDGSRIVLPPLLSPADRWMNPEYILAKTLAFFEEHHLAGEFPPAAPYFMAGTTLGCGDSIEFGEGGIAIRPCMSSMNPPLNWHPGPDDSWRVKVAAICDRLLDEAPGRFIVPCPAQFDHLDLLNMLRGNTEMLLDLIAEPAACRDRLREMRLLSFENAEFLRRRLESRQAGAGYVSWTNLWSRRHFQCVQADAAAMLSPAMFKEFVLPELDWQGERYGYLHYHTCGYQQHLDLCLSRSYLRVIQYSPSLKEPPNGPAHLEFYRRVQRAHRGLDLAVPPAHVEFLVRHLRPEGLAISTTAATMAEAQELLAAAAHWAGSCAGH